MPALSFVIVLENRLKVNASDFHCFSVLIENLAQIVFIAVSTLQVFTASQESIVLCHWCNSCYGYFLNAGSSKSSVDASAEGDVVKELFRIVSFILATKRFVFLICQFEIQHAKYTAELRLSYVSFAKFVIVIEELLDSDTLHYNG